MRVKQIALLALVLAALVEAQEGNATYYEHMDNFFNTTPPLETLYSTTVTVPPYTEVKAIVFTKDQAEAQDLLVVGDQNVSFYGWFKAFAPEDKDDVFINWQIVDYDPDTGNEIQICRSPISIYGRQITESASPQLLNATCPPVTTYVVPAGHRLRVNIFAFNQHLLQSRTFVHYWDTSARNSRFNVVEFIPGTVSTDLTSPATDLDLAEGTVFNASCQVQCSGGTCTNLRAFIQFSNDTVWKNVAGDNDTIVLN